MSPAPPPLDPRIGYLAVAASAVLFSAKAVIIKLCYGMGVEPVVLMTLRMLFALPFFAAMIVVPRLAGARAPRLGRLDWAAIVILGFLGYYLASLFDLMGLLFVTAGLERLILYVYPTLVVLISAWVFRKRIDSGIIAALVITYVGVALSFGAEALGGTSSRPVLGGLLVLASAVVYAVFLIIQGKVVHRIDPQRLTAWSMIASCVLITAHCLAAYPVRDLIQPMPVYGLILVLAIFSTVLPAWLLGYGLKAVGASKTAVISSVGPVSTFALAGWLLGERTGLLQVAGLGLVLAGGLRLGMAKK